MGVAASRQFACEVADCAEKGVGLESVLKNPEWKLCYGRLPSKLRTSIRAITSPPKEDPLSRVQQVQKSDIGIFKQLRPHFESWKYPRNFFEYDTSVVVAEDTVSQVYVELPRIVDRRVDDPIRARIYAVALYNLRLEVDKSDSFQLRPNVREKIEQVILDSPLIDERLEDISKWTKLFLKFGERMKEIADVNGGLGALMVIPSSLLSVRQWAKRINDAEFALAKQHLQSIDVDTIAKKAGAHAVANRIHSLILRIFHHETIADPDVDMEDVEGEEDEEDSEDTDGDSTHDEEMFDKDDGSSVNKQSTYSNATSVHTRPEVSDQVGHSFEDHSIQAEVEIGQQTTIEKAVHPPHQSSAFGDQQANAMGSMSPLDFLSQAANLAAQQNGPTIRRLPDICMGPEQLSGLGTEELNVTPTNIMQSPSNSNAFPSTLLDNPAGYNLWDYYPNPTVYNSWDYYPSTSPTLHDSTGYNLWDNYQIPNATPGNSSV